jgi:hypothetical protein
MKPEPDHRWTVEDAAGLIHGIRFPSLKARWTWCGQSSAEADIDHHGRVVTCLRCAAAWLRSDEARETRTVTIYVRPTGSDVTGNGRTPETAYLTMDRAMRDIPALIPPGIRYSVDTGPDGVDLPPDFQFPALRSK